MFAKYKHFTTEKSRKLLTAILIALLAFAPFFSAKIADASNISQAFVRFDRVKTSTLTTGTVCFRPSTTGALTSVIVAYPTGYTLGTASAFTTSNTNLAWPSGAVAITGGTTITSPASNVTGQNVTWTLSGSFSNASTYCFNWDNVGGSAVTTQSGATPYNSGSITLSNGDTGNYATPTVSNDQISVSASVVSVFSFALSSNTDALGQLNLSTTTSSATPINATVSTNAHNGWSLWAKDNFTGLCSPSIKGSACTVNSADGQIPSLGLASTVAAGTKGMNFGVKFVSKVGGTTPTISGNFDGTTALHGGGLTPSLQTLLTAPSENDSVIYSLTNNVAIDGTIRAAADYADVQTIIGAGLF